MTSREKNLYLDPKRALTSFKVEPSSRKFLIKLHYINRFYAITVLFFQLRNKSMTRHRYRVAKEAPEETV